jgi:hypothetical protein
MTLFKALFCQLGLSPEWNLISPIRQWQCLQTSCWCRSWVELISLRYKYILFKNRCTYPRELLQYNTENHRESLTPSCEHDHRSWVGGHLRPVHELIVFTSDWSYPITYLAGRSRPCGITSLEKKKVPTWNAIVWFPAFRLTWHRFLEILVLDRAFAAPEQVSWWMEQGT